MKRHEFIHKKAECYPMTEEEFVIWLNGFFEITNATEVGPEQTKIIKEKLQSLFVKETGKQPNPVPNGLFTPNNTMIFGGTSGDASWMNMRNITTSDGAVHRDGLAEAIYGDSMHTGANYIPINGGTMPGRLILPSDNQAPPLNSPTAATVGPPMVPHSC